MHPNEQPIDHALVQSLLASQFPEWVGLPLQKVDSAGTDNAIYRLGSELAVRLPRIDWAVDQIASDFRWLSWLQAQLPLQIPQPIAQGQPTANYPWPWGIYAWLAGENAINARPNNPEHGLSQFLHALQKIDAQTGPAPASPTARGVSLIQRNAVTRAAITQAHTLLDTEQILAVWDHAIQIETWAYAPVWIHGDLHAGNLLVIDSNLSAVIDFGALAVGDPACDLLPAWNMFDRQTRLNFRQAMAVDAATWIRGRGWALSVAVIALPYYHQSNPVLAQMARYSIQQVLDDWNNL
ncbi:aminoglycoside phosphotransferase family protein [Herpetosiphon sp.]|nr:aminoglycoside phosphotransferase family protein [Herpetosiphon sp.]